MVPAETTTWKHPWSFLYIREPEYLLKKGLDHRCFLSWEIFENG